MKVQFRAKEQRRRSEAGTGQAAATSRAKLNPVRRPIRWPATALTIVTVIWTVLMLASLKWRFLDRLVAGTAHGRIADDFFQVPRGYLNLLAGNSIFLTEMGNYGPYCSMYLNHPFLATAIGPWFAAMAPWTFYAVLVLGSLGLLALCGRLLASAFDTPVQRRFVYLVMFCSLPAYLMLWAGQVHVLLILADALILAGLMGMERAPLPQRWDCRRLQLGLLVSLLSKPSVLLMLPVLLLTPETRRKVLLPVAIYSAVSLAFLLVAGLNPGHYNALHWLNIVSASSSPAQVAWVASPCEHDMLQDAGLYSLPVLLDRTLGHHAIAIGLCKLPLVAVLIMSLTPLVVRDRRQRLRLTIVTAAMCILSHYLSYYPVQEYHYAAVPLVLPVLLWLRQREAGPRLRRLLLASFLAAAAVFLPTCNCLTPGMPARSWAASAIVRVAPAAAAFLSLAAYGMAAAWFARSGVTIGQRWAAAFPGPRYQRRTDWQSVLQGQWWAAAFRGTRANRPPAPEKMGELWTALLAGGATAMMLATVATAVYATVPPRFLTPPARWSAQERAAHDEAMVACCAKALQADPDGADPHYVLGGIFLRQLRTREAVAHLCTAVAVKPNPNGLQNLGAAYLSLGQFEKAEAALRDALAIDPNCAGAHSFLGLVLVKRGRLGEAREHCLRALAISPDDAPAHTSLGYVLYETGKFDEAIEQYHEALRLQPDAAGVRADLAAALRACGRLDEAIAQFAESIRLMPDNPWTHLEMAAALAAKGQFAEAESHFRRAWRSGRAWRKPTNNWAGCRLAGETGTRRWPSTAGPSRLLPTWRKPARRSPPPNLNADPAILCAVNNRRGPRPTVSEPLLVSPPCRTSRAALAARIPSGRRLRGSDCRR